MEVNVTEILQRGKSDHEVVRAHIVQRADGVPRIELEGVPPPPVAWPPQGTGAAIWRNVGDPPNVPASWSLVFTQSVAQPLVVIRKRDLHQRIWPHTVPPTPSNNATAVQLLFESLNEQFSALGCSMQY